MTIHSLKDHLRRQLVFFLQIKKVPSDFRIQGFHGKTNLSSPRCESKVVKVAPSLNGFLALPIMSFFLPKSLMDLECGPVKKVVESISFHSLIGEEKLVVPALQKAGSLTFEK